MLNQEKIIISIFNHLYGKKPIRISHRSLHEFFYYIKNKRGYKTLFRNLLFAHNNIYPICSFIDEIMIDLELCGIVIISNRYFKVNTKYDYADLSDDIRIKSELVANEFIKYMEDKK